MKRRICKMVCCLLVAWIARLDSSGLTAQDYCKDLNMIDESHENKMCSELDHVLSKVSPCSSPILFVPI